jgi:MFS family permease
MFTKFNFDAGGKERYRIVFIITSVLLFAAILIVLGMKDTETRADVRRFYFAKKYTKYYMLEVFYGARKQVFFTFAPYALILHYNANASVLALLMAICALTGTILSPVIGMIIDKLGYKVVMVGDTLILVVVCFFFGFSHILFPPGIAFIVVCVNYVLDSIVSIASIASSVYVRDIADNEDEVRATLSSGVSVNHVISIIIALLGGAIWNSLGIEALFVLSAILGVLNSLYAATIKKPVRQVTV